MSRQDKATTDRNARTLRELVKHTDNKNCADCKKNDARWASWNLGVFLCIRCSGIHRSMGTHISKVKSIDLDIWQPEQMESMQKWGNRRANLYWEAHLKAGHLPPDHKMESFIRSKYESRRWVLTDRMPHDPSVLDDANGEHAPLASAPEPAASSYDPPLPRSNPSSNQRPTSTFTNPRAHPLLSTTAGRVPTPTSTTTASTARTRVPQIDLLSGDFGSAYSTQPTPTATSAPPAPGNKPSAGPPTLGKVVATASTESQAAPKAAPGAGLFDLDFKPPAAAKTSNQDILSLFSTSTTTARPTVPLSSPGFGDMMGFGASSGPAPPARQYQAQPPQYQAQSPPRQAVYGQKDSFNDPPTIQSNPQASYATWGFNSGITSSTGAQSGVGGLTGRLGTMGLGGDPWSSSNQTSLPTTYPNPTAQQPKPSSAMQNGSTNHNHFESAQDVWGGAAAPLPASYLHGASSYQQPPVAAQKSLEEDPFKNIWQ